MKTLLLIFTSIILSLQFTFASHSMGHSMCYEYVSYDKNTDLHKYRVRMEFFRDMKGVLFNPPLTVNVFENKPPYNQLTNPSQVTLYEVSRDTMTFDELLGLQCTLKTSGVTSEIFHLEGELELPSSLTGYALQWTSCCRNSRIDNVSTGNYSTGTTIPATLYKNSAPCFIDNPMLLVCKGVPWTFSNEANDPDGDMLVYTLETAYAGDATPPLDQMSSYYNGYDGQNPFGYNSWVTVNSSNGITTVMAADTGTYVISIEVREYRNGVWINTVVRDMQIRVVDCGAEIPAELRASTQCGKISGPNIVLRVQEGDSICCDMPFWDPDGDSIEISYNGQLFNIQNPATLGLSYTDVAGSEMDGRFCFKTKCGSARKVPYIGNIIVENVGGCPMSTTPYKVMVYVDPYDMGKGEIIGEDTVCANSTSIYYVDDTSTTYQYKWFVSGGAVVSSNNDTAKIIWGNTFNTGVILAVRIHGCFTDTLSYTISINPAPIARVQRTFDICAGDSVLLDASLSSATKWSWTPNVNINNTTSSSPIVWPTANQVYTLVVENNYCQPDTVDVTVNVHQLPSLMVSKDTTICEGDYANLLAQSGSGVSFTWSPSLGLSNPNIANPLANPADTTKYIVRAENIAGCWVEDEVTVSINSPNIDIGPLDTITLCLGDTFQSNVSAVNPVSISWTPVIGLSNPNILSPAMYPNVTTQYVIEVINADGCVDSDTLTVEVVNTKLIANAGQDVSICLGESINLLGNGGTKFLWSPAATLSANNISSPVASPITTTTYTLIVNSSSGACLGDTAQITVSVNKLPLIDAGANGSMCLGEGIQLSATQGMQSYNWSPAAGLNNSTIWNPISKAKLTTTYTLEATDINGCVASDTVLIQVDSVSVEALASDDNNICGDPVQLDALVSNGSGSYTYVWYPNFALSSSTIKNPVAKPTANVDYTVEVKDDNSGCVGRANVGITSINKLPLDILNPDTNICIGEGIDIHAIGGHPSIQLDSIRWSPSEDVTNPNEMDTRIHPTESNTYSLSIYYNECKSTDKINVVVSDTPTVWIESVDSICLGDDLSLRANSFGDNNNFKYSWANGDSAKQVKYTMIESGIAEFEITATNVFGCSSSRSKKVVILDALEVKATGVENVTTGDMDIIKMYRGSETLIVGEIFGDYKTFVWSSTANSEVGSELEFFVNPWEDEMFTLTAFNALGCPYESQVLVDVEPTSYVRAPKVFSPNNDGVNDFYTVRSEGWEQPILQIFNRWGELVFTALDLQSINRGWDGKLNGKDQPIGNYIWKFRGNSNDLNTDEKYGSFSLIR